jgi:hypothetical protein
MVGHDTVSAVRERAWWRRALFYDQRPKKQVLYAMIDAVPDLTPDDRAEVEVHVDAILARMDDVHTTYRSPREQLRDFLILQLEHANHRGAKATVEHFVADEIRNPYGFAAVALAAVMIGWALVRWS